MRVRRFLNIGVRKKLIIVFVISYIFMVVIGDKSKVDQLISANEKATNKVACRGKDFQNTRGTDFRKCYWN